MNREFARDRIERILARPAFDASVNPWVPAENWGMISKLAEKSGPKLSTRLFG